MKSGEKHLIECNCVLPQYKDRDDIFYHKFVVFSEIEASPDVEEDSEEVEEFGNVIEKYVVCNNCGVIHRVYDVCQSEILIGKDELRSIISIDELKLELPENISNVLTSYDLDLPTWEHAKFILDNEKWGEYVVLTKDVVNNKVMGKFLRFAGPNRLKIEQYVSKEFVDF